MRRLMLAEFEPRCELSLPRHDVPRSRFPVIDFHTHFGLDALGEDYAERYDAAAEAHRLRDMGVEHVVNLDGFWGTALDAMLRKTEGTDGFFLTFGGVDLSGIDEPDFGRDVDTQVRRAVKLGVLGLKFFKDMSLSQPGKRRVMPDDPRLKPIWDAAARERIPVLIHIADPVAFFRPVDRFNERYEELSEHPDWSFFGPDYPSFEELMEAQQRMLAENPDTTFVIAHVGSNAENLRRVGQWLEEFPNMYVDLAARIAELGRQPYSAREFLIRHQDRVLFGTDYGPGAAGWPIDFRFLETFDEYFRYDGGRLPQQGRWNIYGVGLPDDALRKIYSENARRLLRLSTF